MALQLVDWQSLPQSLLVQQVVPSLLLVLAFFRYLLNQSRCSLSLSKLLLSCSLPAFLLELVRLTQNNPVYDGAVIEFEFELQLLSRLVSRSLASLLAVLLSLLRSRTAWLV